MSAQIPPRTKAEQAADYAEVRRQQQLARSKVHLSRSKRRGSVAVLYLLLAAMFALWAISIKSPFPYQSPGQAAEFGLLLAVIISLGVVNYSVGGLTAWTAKLDERERALRDHATAVGYRVLIVVVVAGTIFAVVASLSNQSLATPQGLLPLGVALIWLVVTLPNAILAWTLSDPEPDPNRQEEVTG